MKGKERVDEVAGREGAPPRGQTPGADTEGRGLQLVEEEELFCLGGKVHRRTSWVEQASQAKEKPQAISSCCTLPCSPANRLMTVSQ